MRVENPKSRVRRKENNIAKASGRELKGKGVDRRETEKRSLGKNILNE
jgi:hypothetical protein